MGARVERMRVVRSATGIQVPEGAGVLVRNGHGDLREQCLRLHDDDSDTGSCPEHECRQGYPGCSLRVEFCAAGNKGGAALTGRARRARSRKLAVDRAWYRRLELSVRRVLMNARRRRYTLVHLNAEDCNAGTEAESPDRP